MSLNKCRNIATDLTFIRINGNLIVGHKIIFSLQRLFIYYYLYYFCLFCKLHLKQKKKLFASLYVSKVLYQNKLFTKNTDCLYIFQLCVRLY